MCAVSIYATSLITLHKLNHLFTRFSFLSSNFFELFITRLWVCCTHFLLSSIFLYNTCLQVITLISFYLLFSSQIVYCSFTSYHAHFFFFLTFLFFNLVNVTEQSPSSTDQPLLSSQTERTPLSNHIKYQSNLLPNNSSSIQPLTYEEATNGKVIVEECIYIIICLLQ